MTNTIRILGIDPGLNRTGWGVVSCTGARLSHVAHGVIAPSASLAFSHRLLALFDALEAIVAEYAPHEAAVEESFVNKNAASSLKLGHARGVVMMAPARAGTPIFEYAARLVKKSVVGTGAADKDQIGFMVRRLLPTMGDAGADAADALAVAITHANLRDARHRGAA